MGGLFFWYPIFGFGSGVTKEFLELCLSLLWRGYGPKRPLAQCRPKDRGDRQGALVRFPQPRADCIPKANDVGKGIEGLVKSERKDGRAQDAGSSSEVCEAGRPRCCVPEGSSLGTSRHLQGNAGSWL